jgi:hypothetical protein
MSKQPKFHREQPLSKKSDQDFSFWFKDPSTSFLVKPKVNVKVDANGQTSFL